MELIFKKYSKSEAQSEKIYLIYDPMQNPSQFTDDLFRSISNRNFIQNCENLLIGPIFDDKKMTVKALGSDGTEAVMDSDLQTIFEAYLKDQGYRTSSISEASISRSADSKKATSTGKIQAFGTVYHFTA